jgi:transcriptional regulator with XRE-family HTH domain
VVISPHGTTLGEVWMQVRDNKLLGSIAESQQHTHRAIAQALGWKSHTMVGRIIRGEVKTVSTDAAIRWAFLYGVPVDFLFLTKASKNPRGIRERRAA